MKSCRQTCPDHIHLKLIVCQFFAIMCLSVLFLGTPLFEWVTGFQAGWWDDHLNQVCWSSVPAILNMQDRVFPAQWLIWHKVFSVHRIKGLNSVLDTEGQLWSHWAACENRNQLLHAVTQAMNRALRAKLHTNRFHGYMWNFVHYHKIFRVKDTPIKSRLTLRVKKQLGT